MRTLIMITALLLGVINGATAGNPNRGNNGHHKSYVKSELFLSSESGLNFDIEIQGVRYSSVNGELFILGLHPGDYNIRIIRDFSFHRSGWGATSAVRRIYIPQESKVNAVIFQGTSLRVAEIVSIAPVYHKQESYCHHTYEVMSLGEYNALRHRVRTAFSEREKVNEIRYAIRYNYFTADQIAGLVDLLSFESSRLDVAKMGFEKTVNKREYYLVANELYFESSVRELNRYTGVDPVCRRY